MAGYSDPADYLGGVLGSPVTLTSGYRSPQKNTLVGGVPNSAHLTGQAYDFVPKGISTKDAADRLAKSGIPFDQLIDENDHVHISFAPTNRRQVIPSKMGKNVSDDDLLAVMGGSSASAGKPAGGDYFPAGDSRNSPAAVTVGSGQKNVTDDQLLSVMGGAGEAAGGGSAPPPAKAAGDKSSYMGKPFGFTEEVESHIPFAKDFAAGVPAALDAITGKGSLGANYRQNLSDYNAAQAGYEANNPLTSDVGAGLGFLASGGPARGAVGSLVQAGKGIFPKLAEIAGPKAAPQTLRQLMASGAKGGATLGALFGAGEAGDGSGGLGGRLVNTAVGAGTGLLTGIGLPVLGAGVAAGGRAVGGLVNRLTPDAATLADRKARAILENFSGGPLQIRNSAEIVPGSKPTLPEATGNAGAAGLYDALRDLNPNSPLVTREAENAAARGTHFSGAAGTPEEIKAAQDARDAVATKQRKAIWGGAAPTADIAPVHKTIDDILAGDAGARPAVKKAMAEVKAILDNDGKPVTSPKALYESVRQGIGDLLDGKDLTKAYGKQAARQLIAVRDSLDDAIETSAPGFKKYLEDYAKASTPANAMEFLQGLNLTNKNGNITLQSVQTALKRLKAQQAGAGIQKGKAVTTAQQQALESIRDDLLRAENLKNGKSIGSPTVQKALAQKRLGLSQFIPEGLGATLGGIAGHHLAGPYGGEVGGLVGARIGNLVGAGRRARQLEAQNLLQSTLEEMMLNPSKYQNPHQGIPSAVRPLNDILSGPKARAAMAAGNRLVIAGQSRPKEKSR